MNDLTKAFSMAYTRALSDYHSAHEMWRKNRHDAEAVRALSKASEALRLLTDMGDSIKVSPERPALTLVENASDEDDSLIAGDEEPHSVQVFHISGDILVAFIDSNGDASALTLYSTASETVHTFDDRDEEVGFHIVNEFCTCGASAAYAAIQTCLDF